MGMSWQPDRPYDALPLLPPGSDLESKLVLKQCVGARSALAELKVAAALIPSWSGTSTAKKVPTPQPVKRSDIEVHCFRA